MENYAAQSLEREMIDYNFVELHKAAESAKERIANAKTAADVTTEVCKVWHKIAKYVILAEAIPVVGKYIKILAGLLNAICKAAAAPTP